MHFLIMAGPGNVPAFSDEAFGGKAFGDQAFGDKLVNYITIALHHTTLHCIALINTFKQ